MQPAGPPDMSALLAQAQQMQQQLLAAQRELINAEVHGQAGGGLVRVTAKGSGEVIAVTVDPKVVDPNDIETLQDLIVGALSDAGKQVTALAQQRLAPLTGAMGRMGGAPGGGGAGGASDVGGAGGASDVGGAGGAPGVGGAPGLPPQQ